MPAAAAELLVGKRVGLGVMEDPVDILGVAGARTRVGDGTRVYAGSWGAVWREKAGGAQELAACILYGFQELKAQTRWLDLMERLCRVA